MTSPCTIASSWRHPVERTSDSNGEGGSNLRSVPSILAGSYLPSFTNLEACLFPTFLVPLASRVPCTSITATLRKIRLPRDSSLSLRSDELHFTSYQIASFLVCYSLVKQLKFKSKKRNLGTKHGHLARLSRSSLIEAFAP